MHFTNSIIIVSSMHTQRNQSQILRQKSITSPQVNIYNRHFYLRGAQHSVRQQQYEQQWKQLANKPKISPASYHILCEQLESKLMKAFAKYCNRVSQDGNNWQMDGTYVDFLQLQNITSELCKVDGASAESLEHFLSQLWLVLGEYSILSEIKANILYTCLRIFLDPYNLSEEQYKEMLCNFDQFSKANQNREKFLKEYPDLREETLTVNQIIRLWKKIRYSNPSIIKMGEKVVQHKVEYSFCPEINKKSQLLASKSLKKYLETHESALNRTLKARQPRKDQNQNQLSRYLDNNETYEVENSRYFSKPTFHDILFQRKLQKDELKIKMPEEGSFYTSQVSRTARPEQIKQIVNNLYVVKPKRQDTDFGKIDEEKQLKLCTFSPKINKNYYGSRSSVSPVVNGYEKQVSRLNKGREQKEKKKQAYENLGRVKNFSRNYSKSPNRSIAPTFIDRDTPKLILQINIDGDRVQKLPLKGNQNPHLVSKKFVIMHGLEPEMIEVLEALVQKQLSKL